MTGYVRTDVTDQIANGNTVDAIPLDQEFDAITSAFTSVSGHRHNGSVGEGAPITVLGPTQNVVVSSNSITPSVDDFVDLGSTTNEFKNLWIDGVAQIDSLVADTADVNGGTIDATVIGATTPAAATVTTLTATSATVGGAAVATGSNTQTLTNKTIDLTNNTLIATSAQIDAAVTDNTGTGPLVFGSNPSFTGTPSAPTAAVNTNTTQIATTAYVIAQIADDAPAKTGAGASGSWAINAATATLLQIPRTINGTLFSGGADITTLAWGTDRTITIGGTAKIVNGTANISWSLGEIGAQTVNPQLTGLSSLTNTPGLVTQTAANSFAVRSIAVGAGTGLSIVDGNAIAGNPTLSGVVQAQAVWDAGTSTTESVISPSKLVQATGQVFFLRESTANGVGSTVTLTATTWVKRLVTSVVNTITGASVASGVITLPAGTYRVTASGTTSINVVSESVLRIRNTTAGTTAVIGRYARERDEVGGEPGASVPVIDGVFVLASASNIELQQWSLTTLGGGSGSPATGEAEVHADITLHKVG